MGSWNMIRQAAGGLSEDEHLQAIRDGAQSLKERGLLPGSAPPLSTESKFDTGHYVDHVLDGRNGNWETYITHDSDLHGINRAIVLHHGDLGGDHSRLGEAVHRALRHPDVMQSMREQMAHGDSPEPRWFRDFDVSGGR